ncbi:hypothetical protein [Streptomyces roseolus]|uniref:hypothetical protein n=1 Tax=Streptomyces roseolus TaxID=67358 RepID=UPI0036F0D15B
MKIVSKRTVLGGAATAAALVMGVATSASAVTVGFHQSSGSGKAEIGGTYKYWQAGEAGGRTLYDGSFSGAYAKDKVSGDGYEAVLALKYDSFEGGAWRTVKNKVAVVNGSKSWTFKNKANVIAYACDRKVGRTALENCKRAW